MEPQPGQLWLRNVHYNLRRDHHGERQLAYDSGRQRVQASRFGYEWNLNLAARRPLV